MIIFLYGPDEYRLRRNLLTVEAGYGKKYQSGINLLHLDCAVKEGVEMLENSLKSISFFGEKKLLVAKNTFTQKPASSKIADLLGHFKVSESEDTIFLAIEPTAGSELARKNTELFKILSDSKNLVREFNFLQGAKLSAWIRQEFADSGFSIEPAAAGLLIDAVGKDSWALRNEIDKLINYKQGRTITVGDVMTLVSRESEVESFALTDAIAAKNKQKAFELLYRETEADGDPYQILGGLIYQFRNLLMVKDLSSRSLPPSSIAKKAGLHPFVVQKTLSWSKAYDKEELGSILKRLAEFDIASKNGLINLTDSLFNFVLR